MNAVSSWVLSAHVCRRRGGGSDCGRPRRTRAGDTLGLSGMACDVVLMEMSVGL